MSKQTKSNPPAIESGIPIPPPARETLKGITATLRKMNNGDSVLLSRQESFSWRAQGHACGIKVTVRKVSAKECRLWRVS